MLWIFVGNFICRFTFYFSFLNGIENVFANIISCLHHSDDYFLEGDLAQSYVHYDHMAEDIFIESNNL